MFKGTLRCNAVSRYWLQAAANGSPNASIKAQSALGMFYSRPETLDLRKVSVQFITQKLRH